MGKVGRVAYGKLSLKLNVSVFGGGRVDEPEP